MAEGKPPYGDIHPMRAIFMIPTKPPPTFRDPERWSPEFIDFVSRCLVKNPEQRSTATALLQHEFILKGPPVTILQQMIQEAKMIHQEMIAKDIVSCYLIDICYYKFFNRTTTMSMKHQRLCQHQKKLL